jgi:hypothetical protein
MIAAILRTSDTWKENDPMRSHRVAPPCVRPRPGIKIIRLRNMAKAKSQKEIFRQYTTSIFEKAYRATSPGKRPKNICLNAIELKCAESRARSPSDAERNIRKPAVTRSSIETRS